MGWFKNLVFGKELSDVLNETKTIKASGVRFTIKKLSEVNHVEGLNILIETYATYDKKRHDEKMSTEDDSKLIEKVKKIYAEIFMASVVYPKLTMKKGDHGQYVYDLFDDWNICHALYEQIMTYSNKKKMKRRMLLGQSY